MKRIGWDYGTTYLAFPIDEDCLFEADRKLHDEIKKHPWLEIGKFLGLRYVRHTFFGFMITNKITSGAFPCWIWKIEDNYWEYQWNRGTL